MLPALNPFLFHSYGADLFAAEFVQQQRFKARFNVDSLTELSIGSTTPRVNIVRRAQTRAVVSSARYRHHHHLTKRENLLESEA